MIKLIHPKNGEIVSLLTDEQRKFLDSDRSNITVETYDILGLKNTGNEYSRPKAVSFEWECDDTSELMISEDPDFDDSFSVTASGNYSKYNLKIGTVYYWKVFCNGNFSEVFSFKTEDICPRLLYVDGLTNVRDIGGWRTVDGKRIKQGLLFRGSEMNSHLEIKDAGLQTLENDLHIKSDLDIRGSSEELKDVYKKVYVNIPGSSYDWLENKSGAKALFDFICNEDNYPVYFHCWGGADRTGIFAFMIECILEMYFDDIIDDYEITSLAAYGPRSRNSDHFKHFMSEFNSLPGNSYLDKALKFILDCGISQEQIDRFRSFMIQD